MQNVFFLYDMFKIKSDINYKNGYPWQTGTQKSGTGYVIRYTNGSGMEEIFFFLRRPLGRYIELGKNWREMLQLGYLKSAVLETTVGVKFPIVRQWLRFYNINLR